MDFLQGTLQPPLVMDWGSTVKQQKVLYHYMCFWRGAQQNTPLPRTARVIQPLSKGVFCCTPRQKTCVMCHLSQWNCCFQASVGPVTSSDLKKEMTTQCLFVTQRFYCLWMEIVSPLAARFLRDCTLHQVSVAPGTDRLCVKDPWDD